MGAHRDGELLPEFWSGPKDGEGETRERRARQGRKVTEIFTWLQCYSSFVVALAPTEPQVIPELMAYMGLIVRVCQDYEGLGWVLIVRVSQDYEGLGWVLIEYARIMKAWAGC